MNLWTAWRNRLFHRRPIPVASVPPHVRVTLLTDLENPAAPTAAELAAGVDLTRHITEPIELTYNPHPTRLIDLTEPPAPGTVMPLYDNTGYIGDVTFGEITERRDDEIVQAFRIKFTDDDAPRAGA